MRLSSLFRHDARFITLSAFEPTGHSWAPQMKAFLFLAVFGISSQVCAEYEDPAADLKKGQPKPVVNLIDRILGCNHWGGEEPYDAERAKQIEEAATRLRCLELDSDEATLLKQHHGDPRIKQVLDAAKELAL